jgi:hypothetical protein
MQEILEVESIFEKRISDLTLSSYSCYLAEVLQMTTYIPAGTGSLHYSATLGQGQGCRKTSWVSGVTYKRSIQKELSWYIFRNQFLYTISLIILYK